MIPKRDRYDSDENIYSCVRATQHSALSVGPSVRPSITLHFFGVNELFGLDVPWWLPTRSFVRGFVSPFIGPLRCP